MATFAYVARDASGKRVEGRVTGASSQAALAELASRQLAPVSLNEIAEGGGRGLLAALGVGARDSAGADAAGNPAGLALFQKRVPTRKLATFYRQLADLLRAGVPLMRALRVLARSKSNPLLAEVVGKVADGVADGARLADAMGNFPHIFPDIQMAMVRAGERGGFLEAVLERLGAFLEHQAELRGKIIGNLIYPFVLVFVMLAVVVFALVVFVPRFKTFYARIELPWATKVLLGASDLLTGHWLLVLIAIAALGTACVWLSRRKAVQEMVETVKLRTPGLGPVVLNLAIGRFTRILGTLLENGIPMLNALQISQDSAGIARLRTAVENATEAVRAGEPLARPLADSGLFEDEMVEIISVGETSNRLAPVLIGVADMVEKRVDRLLNIFLRMMEPVILLGLAAIVLFIFVALIVPMMRMSSAI